MFQLQEYMSHPCEICGLTRLWALNNNYRRLPLLILLSSLLLDGRQLVRDQLCYRFPVLFVCLSMELLLVSQKQLDTNMTIIWLEADVGISK